jgi:hypothetical protein
VPGARGRRARAGAGGAWEEIPAGIETGRRRDLALLAQIGEFDDELAAAALGRDSVDVPALLSDFPLVGYGAAVHTIHPLWRPHLA